MTSIVEIILATTGKDRVATRAALSVRNMLAPSDREVIQALLKQCVALDGDTRDLNEGGDLIDALPHSLPGKTFEAAWGASYVEPGTKTVDAAFFGNDFGYSDLDRDLIADLDVGKSVLLDAGDHKVTRIS